ncbi:MAG: methyltransferase domain-containing protein [Elusimicrobia bacterium]|nr:methyltransferase domain-containing protein [Elusimicrobiota bacterium]
MNKNKIIENFSRYATVYDEYANVQQMAAGILIKELLSEKGRAEYILEVGCGTGNYTTILKQEYKNANIKAIDISEKMIEVARQKLKDSEIGFIVDDAETIDLNNHKFNIITSNAAFQWFENIEDTIVKYSNSLAERGVISFSIFGPLTFKELNMSIRETLSNDIQINSKNFLEKEKIEAILKRYFMKVSIKEVIIIEKYHSLMDFLNKIRYTGTRGNGINGEFRLTQEVLKKIEQKYRSIFGQIIATYQIYFCNGIK